jgi:glyoxylase-like metal-dependent hydrolase (beta-lactamase superfamily II)
VAAPYVKDRRGGALGIGENVSIVQDIFGKVFNAGAEFQRDGRQFDHLFTNGERFTIGELDAVALHTPGNTPDSVTYVIGDAAFVGGTAASRLLPAYGQTPGRDPSQLEARRGRNHRPVGLG